MTSTGRDDWESHWNQYAAAAALNPAQHMRFDSILSALRMESWPTSRLLDVGSGQGDFLLRAIHAGAARAYAGFEISESGVSVSRSKAPQAAFFSTRSVFPNSRVRKPNRVGDSSRMFGGYRACR